MKRNTRIEQINKIIKEFGSFDVHQVVDLNKRPTIMFDDYLWLAESFHIGEASILGFNGEIEKHSYRNMTNDELAAIFAITEKYKAHCQSQKMKDAFISFEDAKELKKD